jgi:uncharacterized protein
METDRFRISTLALCLGVVVAVEAIARLATQGKTFHPMMLLGAMRLLQAGFIVATVFLRGKGLASIGLSWKGLIPGLRKGCIWSAGFGLLVLLGGVFLHVMGINPLPLIHTPLPSNPGHVFLFFIVGGIIGPVTEEILFRGVLYGFFRRWGALTAILLSTLAFALAHAVFPAIPIIQVVGGLLFALAYELEKNLMAPITIHSLGNMAIFALSLLPISAQSCFG